MLRLSAQAQAPAWQMAVAVGASGNDWSQVSATAADTSGNVYLTGFFGGTATFGSTILNSAGVSDVFVAKWNPATGFVWAQRAGSGGDEIPYALAVRGSSIYVAGAFGSNTAAFGSISLTNADATANSKDAFVARITDGGSSGTWTWAQRAGGSNDDAAWTIGVNGSSIYVAGQFQGTASFGSTLLTTAGLSDGYVAKLTDGASTGSWMWAYPIGGPGNDDAIALAVSGASIYITGAFSSTAISLGASTLALAGIRDLYVARLTDGGSTGSWLWAQRAGGSQEETAIALALHGTTIYVAGRFYSPTADFGATTLTNANPSPANPSADVFVAKLTDSGSSGVWIWAQRAGANNQEVATALAVSGSSIYVAGSYQGRASFGSTTLTPAGQTDVFVAKLTDGGSSSAWTWVQQAGGASYDHAAALAISSGSIYAAGAFSSPAISFGSSTLMSASGGSYSTSFLASLADLTLDTPNEQAITASTLSPNPAHEVAYLTGAAPGALLTVFDALARPVWTATADTRGAAMLNLRGLPAGVYLVRGASTARRLVIE